MLILNSKQVKYCHVLRQAGGQVERVPGVAYQGKLFIKGESYGQHQKQEAISRGRQLILQQDKQVLFLVVEDPTGFTLWYQDDRVQLAAEVSTINLEKLVTQMRGVEGLQIEDRWYHLQLYPRCFVGHEAVMWISKHLQFSRTEAVELGQRLIDEKWIHHVVDEHPFREGYFFYRFYLDE